MEAANSHAKSQTSDDVGVAIHTREGFMGDVCAMLRPNSVHQYAEVSGPHAPHRVDLSKLPLPDRDLLRIYERIMDVMRQIQQEEIAPQAEVEGGGDTELDNDVND